MTIPTPHIWVQATPNPETFKFVVDRTLLKEGTAVFTSQEQAAGSPLPATLFDMPEVKQVFVGMDYISISKNLEADWNQLTPKLVEAIKQVLITEKNPVSAAAVAETARPKEVFDPKDQEIVEKIKKVLDDEIRPAVAMDGGDLQFHGYADGVVTLYLHGACSSCPSSTMTLRMGVENRLKSLIPEIREVIQI